jgi:hypothetical protein
MMLQRVASTASAIDVLDHVLDKGIVFDAWIRVSVAAIDLITVAARVVVASAVTGADQQSRAPAGPTLERRRREPGMRGRAESRLRDELSHPPARTLKSR